MRPIRSGLTFMCDTIHAGRVRRPAKPTGPDGSYGAPYRRQWSPFGGITRHGLVFDDDFEMAELAAKSPSGPLTLTCQQL